MTDTETPTKDGICRSMIKKLQAFRQGDRLMLSHEMNMNLSLHRRSRPEKKCGIIKTNGTCSLTVIDAVLYTVAAAAAIAVLGAVCSLGSGS